MSILSRVAVVVLLVAAPPLAAQNAATLRPMVAPVKVAPVKVDAVQVDWKVQYDKERAKNQALRGQVASLQAELASWTSKGGSQVHAYCETETLSRNSAGARNDCAASGYRCEPVSGLCRTSARVTADCAPYFVLQVDHCVPQPTGG